MFAEYIIYIFYGSAFFTLGVAVFAKDKKYSNLEIAKIIWMLGLFGFIHGVHEWLELYRIFDSDDSDGFIYGHGIRLFVISLSYIILFIFGSELNYITFGKFRKIVDSKLYLTAAVLLVSIPAFFIIKEDVRQGTVMFIRYFVGFPSALLSGLGLIGYSKTVKHISAEGARNFAASGAAMIAYAFFTGLFQSETIVPVINIQIIAFRGFCAVLILHFMMKALNIFDVEHMKMIEDRLNGLAQSEKLSSIGKLAAGIAHEINNPLTNASLGIEMIREQAADRQDVLKKLASVEKNIDRASKIAKELLLFAREKDAEFEYIDSEELIESLQVLFSSNNYGKRIVFSSVSGCRIKGIIWKLEEVLINLIMNSVEASPENSRIDVRCFAENGELVIKVEDRGCGIAQDYMSRVFDPFFTTKEVGKGTGMGLYICYNIVKMHGGSIRIENREGGGTVVTVAIPGECGDERKDTDN